MACNNVKDIIQHSGLRVTIDDSDARPGSKYFKWELQGTPVRIEIGPRDLKNNSVVMVKRTGGKTNIPIDEIVPRINKAF